MGLRTCGSGGDPYVRCSSATAISKNARCDRRAAGICAPRDGRRASTRNAAGSVASDNAAPGIRARDSYVGRNLAVRVSHCRDSVRPGRCRGARLGFLLRCDSVRPFGAIDMKIIRHFVHSVESAMMSLMKAPRRGWIIWGRRLGASVCLIASVLLYAPDWTAAWQTGSTACCNGIECRVHAHAGSDKTAKPEARDDGNTKCHQGSSRARASCSISCRYEYEPHRNRRGDLFASEARFAFHATCPSVCEHGTRDQKNHTFV